MARQPDRDLDKAPYNWNKKSDNRLFSSRNTDRYADRNQERKIPERDRRSHSLIAQYEEGGVSQGYSHQEEDTMRLRSRLNRPNIPDISYRDKGKDITPKKYNARNEIGEFLPLPPPLDFPVHSRIYEYRRVDEHHEDSTLGPELHPFEENQPHKEDPRKHDNPTEAIDILPQRNLKREGSQLNLIAAQSLNDNFIRIAPEDPETFNPEKNEFLFQNLNMSKDDYEQHLIRGVREPSRRDTNRHSDFDDDRSIMHETLHSPEPRRIYHNSSPVNPQTRNMYHGHEGNRRDIHHLERRPVPLEEDFGEVGLVPYDERRNGTNARFRNRSASYLEGSFEEERDLMHELQGKRGTGSQGRQSADRTLDERGSLFAADDRSLRKGSSDRKKIFSEDLTEYGEDNYERKHLASYDDMGNSVDAFYKARNSIDNNGAKDRDFTNNETVYGSAERRSSGFDGKRTSMRSSLAYADLKNPSDKTVQADDVIRRVSQSQQTKSSTESLKRQSVGENEKVSFTGKRSSINYNILKEDIDEAALERRDSVLLPVLEETEKEFHDLVEAGDVEAVNAFLNKHEGFNINCVNYQKISALHVAVHSQNEAMVDFLLQQRSLDCSDCALYAIKEGNIRIVEKILDKIRNTSPNLEFATIAHSVDFPDDMTPLILAAQLGNYEIIDFLIKRDHFIPPVHNPYCNCESCKSELGKYDRLKYSTMKLNLYKAISNPMYIFHVTDDPFQRAFELTKELQDAAKVFPQFKPDYEELWKELRNFTVDLIGCCRNSQEVEIVLKKSANNVAGGITFPRLQYAIDLKQKEFVSHPYTQAVLVDAWTGDLLEWKVRSPLMQTISVFGRIPMLPIMAILCMFLPNHKLVRKWKTPVNKMISSIASYIIFLIILFLESNQDKKNQKRGPPNSGLELLIIVYVIGYVWLNIRICFRLGAKRFFSTMWHWFDCMMLFLFIMTFIFWIASLADITANNEIDLPRKYWSATDPELIAEGFFAAAVIMAFFRLNLFLSLNYHLGPLQVSIGKMTLDILKFIIIFFIIILAWCAGLCRFYQPYDGMVQKDAVSGSTTTQVSSFVSFSMTLKTFFWAIFGMSPIESADVVIENLPGDTPESTIINHHEFTETVGYIAFALFQFLSVVVVLNMLVACMANTFTKVIDNVTVEWVFGRSQVYLSFMAATVLPPPFNLLPTAAGIKSMFTWIKLLVKPSGGQKAKWSIVHCCFIESETEPYVNNEFPSLISELAQRYIRLKGDVAKTHDDMEELKCEVKELMRKMDNIILAHKHT